MNKDLSCLRVPTKDASTHTLMFREFESMKSVSGHSFPIRQNIPRFVHAENYSDDFGAQWNMFPKTQLDSFTGLDIR